jgi:hypothetical protein
MINFPSNYRLVERKGNTYIWRRHAVRHDSRCDRDLCHPDCSIRRQREADDLPYPGKKVYR